MQEYLWQCRTANTSRGNRKRDPHDDKSRVIPVHMAQVQTCDCTCAKEESTWRTLLSYMCAHNRLPLLKELDVAVTWGTVSLLATDNYPHIDTSSPAIYASSPWFTWLNESTTNRKLVCPPLLQVSFWEKNPILHLHWDPLYPRVRTNGRSKIGRARQSTNLFQWRLISYVCLMPNVRQL